jgi:hypothetical protein
MLREWKKVGVILKLLKDKRARKRPLGRSKHSWKDTARMDFKYIDVN